MRTAVLTVFATTILLFQVKSLLAQKPELVLPIGHTGVIISAAFSPDGKYIVTASEDRTAKIWDVQNGKLLYTLEGHKERIWNASYSPDSKRIVTASEDKTAKIWDAQSGKVIHTLKGHTSSIGLASYISDAKYIVTSSFNNFVIIWDAQSGKLVHTLKGRISPGWGHNSISSPDGKNIITVSYDKYDKVAKVWDVQHGKLLYTLEGHKERIWNARYSSDGKSIVTVSADKTAKIWDAQSGKLLHSLEEHSNSVNNAVYSPDGKSLITGSTDNTVKIWDVQSGEVLHTISLSQGFGGNASYSPDSKSIVTTSKGIAKIWDVQSGEVVHTLRLGFTGNDFMNASYSPNGRSIVTGSFDGSTQIWDAQSGILLHSLVGHSNNINNAFFNPEDNSIVTASDDNTAKIWEVQRGKLPRSLEGHSDYVNSAIYSPDGKSIVTVSRDKTAKIWDAQSGKLLQSLVGHSNYVNNAVYSSDGKSIVTASDDNTAKIWDALSGILLQSLEGHSNSVNNAVYSPDGKSIVTVSRDNTAKIWDTQSAELLRSLEGHSKNVSTAVYSPDSKSVVTASVDGTAKIWDVQNGKLLNTLEGHIDWGWVHSASYSPDGNRVVTASADKTAKIWDAQSGKLLHSLEGHTYGVLNANYSPNGNSIITASTDNTLKRWDALTGNLISTIELNARLSDIDWTAKRILATNNSSVYLFDLETGKEIIRWVAIDKQDWVITHSSGLFDASPGAMHKLYFVSGLDIVDFSQLKTRYYEPGLGKKVMSGEKLRNVVGFNEVELPPDIRVGQVDSKGNLPIEVLNRGGGIGEVTLYINGKEVIRDLRKPGSEVKGASLSFSVPVSSNKNLIAGVENYLGVKAWNAGQWIESRATAVPYTPPSKSEIKPAIYIVVCGVSDYTGNEIDLKYAAKDADDMAKALELGAKRLFGIDRSIVYTLTTNQKQNSYPTKANIVSTFDRISTTASSSDVMVVYLSGHGINLGGTDEDFYYLTQDAYTANANAYNDPAIKQQATLSSQELVEMFKKVPALKQVLMIDACASGKVVDNLIAKRDIESGTLRALDRMKDRTGLHIITGCTADAVSYEASRYGQGVLTYSLLEGMRGLALREDKFIDVNQLFQFAQERVPILASGIGGIQTPQVFSPNGSQSFDLGELTTDEKKQITLAKARPIYIRSTFIDEQKFRDVLGLGKKMDEMLNEVSVRGETSPLLFVDVSEYPDACQISGQYKNIDGSFSMKLNIICEGKESLHTVESIDEKELLDKIMLLLKK